MAGKETEVLIALVADDGHTFWSRVRLTRSPVEDSWVLLHARRLPRSWQLLSEREREVIAALNDSGLNPKRAAKQLGIALNTLNAHRRSISQKCQLQGVGEFWVFVERCR
jgi:FixJ family two-component response regulator